MMITSMCKKIYKLPIRILKKCYHMFAYKNKGGVQPSTTDNANKTNIPEKNAPTIDYKQIITNNINKDVTAKQKRVLLCYLNNYNNKQDLTHARHTNWYEKYVIEKYFIDRNYEMDICDCNSASSVMKLKDNHYDVIFGFGSAFRWAANNWPMAEKILYYTESPYWFSNEREKERVRYFFERTGIEKRLNRTGRYYEEHDEELADDILAMCDTAYVKNNKKGRVKHIYPHGLRNDNYVWKRREKKGFLIFMSGGYIHKGLDIIVEAFKKLPDLELYVGGNLNGYKQDFGELQQGNVLDLGFIDISSQQFIDVASKCMFILCPSCSEGCPTGVLTCMRHGLIPVISRGIGLDGIENIYYLDDYKIEYLTDRIKEISEESLDLLNKRSAEIYNMANDKFSIGAFKERFYNSMDDLLADGGENYANR